MSNDALPEEWEILRDWPPDCLWSKRPYERGSWDSLKLVALLYSSGYVTPRRGSEICASICWLNNNGVSDAGFGPASIVSVLLMPPTSRNRAAPARIGAFITVSGCLN